MSYGRNKVEIWPFAEIWPVIARLGDNWNWELIVVFFNSSIKQRSNRLQAEAISL